MHVHVAPSLVADYMLTDPCDWGGVCLVLCELPSLGQGELEGADTA